MLIFQLAKEFSEPDPRKIAELPATIIQHWQAFFALENKDANMSSSTPPPPSLAAEQQESDQCAAVMRMLGHG